MPPTPRRIDRYDLGPVLGRGGMGVVHRARDPALDREVALKVLLPGAGATQAERLRREGRALGRLDHPNIIKIHAAGEDTGGARYVVMDLVRGESLQQRLEREGPLAPEEAARLASKVARALEHAHAAGIVHRDVKPANVLVDAATGEPLLGDFGIAREEGAEALTVAGRIIGTLGFCAPEQVRGDSIDARTDVFGLGATLYALLTGAAPHEGDSLIELVARAHDPIAPPSTRRPEVDAALDAICCRALATAPADRFQTMAALAEALEGWLERRRPRRPARRGRGGLVAGGVVAAVVGAAVACAAALWPERGPAPAPPGVAALPDAAPAALPPPAIASPGPTAADVGQLRARAAALLARSDFARALAVGREALALDPDDATSHGHVGAALAGLGDAAGALGSFDRALTLDPAQAPALAGRAALREQDGDLGGALEDLRRALDLHRDDVDLLRRRATLRRRAGDASGALADLTRALELEPADARTWGHRGALREAAGDHRGAVEDFDRALALAPDDPWALTDRGVSRANAGDPEGAIADLERALTLSPSTLTTLTHLGRLYRRVGDHGRAVATLTRVIGATRPQQGALYAERGASRLALGDLPGARADLVVALRLLPPGSVEAQEVEADLARVEAARGQE